MSNKTKIILTVIGICAVVVPVILMSFLTKKVDTSVSVPTEQRSINQGFLQKLVQGNPPSNLQLVSPTPAASSLPSQSSPSAVPPQEGTGAAF